MSAFSRFQVSIRVGLAAGIAAAVLLTAALIHFPWSITARSSLGALTERLNAQLIDSIAGKVDALLGDAAVALTTLAANIRAGTVDLQDKDKRESFLLSFVANQPTLSVVEFAWPDDRSSAVRRMLDETVDIAETTIDGGQALERIDHYRLGEDGRLVFDHRQIEASDYKATAEFWYRFAFLQEEPAWSNIYPLAHSGKLGVTIVQPVMMGEALEGVLAVSLTLDAISHFLEGIEASPNGLVFMTNTYGEMVATQQHAEDPMPHAMTPDKIGRLGEAEQPLIRVAVAALADAGLELKNLTAPRQLAFESPETGETYFVALAPVSAMDLIVAAVVPETDILGEINRNTERLIYALLAFIALVTLFAAWLARRSVARPLVAVTEDARKLGEFRFEEIRPVSSWLEEISTLSGAVTQMSASLSSFRKYVPLDVVRTLFSQGVEAELGGERRELTLFFMDLANFTRIAEQLGEDLIPFLAEFLSEMSETIRDGGGTIDKYIGDAIMAFWGAPVANQQHALFACRAALACQARLAAMRTRAPSGLPEMRARIGLNSGSVLVGNFGSRERLNYTAVGDPVNVASRLEALNKLYGTEILIGEDTFRAVEASVVARRLDQVAVYGKAKGIALYELLSLRETADAALVEWVALFERGTAALRDRVWDEAIALFEAVIAQRGGEDGPSRHLIERARRFRAEPPAADWDGLVILSEK